jgi:hypothetical protein
MVSESPKPSCCLRVAAPQILALAAAAALAILALTLMTEPAKRGAPAPVPSAPQQTAPAQPLFMPLRHLRGPR